MPDDLTEEAVVPDRRWAPMVPDAMSDLLHRLRSTLREQPHQVTIASREWSADGARDGRTLGSEARPRMVSDSLGGRREGGVVYARIVRALIGASFVAMLPLVSSASA
jgi:hypothetical protein